MRAIPIADIARVNRAVAKAAKLLPSHRLDIAA
jgi:hypothetical protein